MSRREAWVEALGFPHSAVGAARWENEWRPVPGKVNAGEVNTAQRVNGKQQGGGKIKCEGGQKPVSLMRR